MENSNVTTLVPKEKSDKKEILNSLSPREIVSELDRFVVGQKNAKKAVKNANRGNSIGEPCSFLINNVCSIYEFRPYFCRRHQVFTPNNGLCIDEQKLELDQMLLDFSEINKSYGHILSEYGDISFKDIREYFS